LNLNAEPNPEEKDSDGPPETHLVS
jgi:hypothetical protein